VRYFDSENSRDLIFLSNHLDIPAAIIAEIYRMRWQIELFFDGSKDTCASNIFLGQAQCGETTNLDCVSGTC